MKQEQRVAEVSTTHAKAQAAYAEIKSQPLGEYQPEAPRPQFRVVKLQVSSCCGCGCHAYEVRREVPYDSPLKDGDVGGKLTAIDKILKKLW